MSQSELACVYAALILHDDGVDISVRHLTSSQAVHTMTSWCDLGLATSRDLVWKVLELTDITYPLQAENISTIVKAAGVTVEPYWPGLFAKLFENKSIADLITNVGAGMSSKAFLISTFTVSVEASLLMGQEPLWCWSCKRTRRPF